MELVNEHTDLNGICLTENEFCHSVVTSHGYILSRPSYGNHNDLTCEEEINHNTSDKDTVKHMNEKNNEKDNEIDKHINEKDMLDTITENEICNNLSSYAREFENNKDMSCYAEKDDFSNDTECGKCQEISYKNEKFGELSN